MSDSGEGRWTILAAIESGAPAPCSPSRSTSVSPRGEADFAGKFFVRHALPVRRTCREESSKAGRRSGPSLPVAESRTKALRNITHRKVLDLRESGRSEILSRACWSFRRHRRPDPAAATHKALYNLANNRCPTSSPSSARPEREVDLRGFRKVSATRSQFTTPHRIQSWTWFARAHLSYVGQTSHDGDDQRLCSSRSKVAKPHGAPGNHFFISPSPRVFRAHRAKQLGRPA